MPLIRGGVNSVTKRNILPRYRATSVINAIGGTAIEGTTDQQTVYTGTTTGDTQTEIFINGITDARITVASGGAVYFNGHCYGVEASDVTKFIYYRLNGVIYNNSGTTQIATTIEKLRTTTSNNTKLVMSADDTTDTLRVYGYSGAGLTHNWYVKLNIYTI